MIAVFVDEQGIWLAVLCPSAVSMGELHSKLLMDLKGRVQEIHEVIGRNHFKQSFHLCTVSAALTSSGIYSQLNSKWLPRVDQLVCMKTCQREVGGEMD